MKDFLPPPLLRSPHLQTLLSSRLVRQHDGVGTALMASARMLDIPCRDGVRLQALVNPAERTDAPLLVLVHGWLGRPDSPYVRRASTALHAAGFAVARLLLRDHGGTSHLNTELFNAARIEEVVDACNWLAESTGATRCGLLGFSLGGNFVLRIAAHPETSDRFCTGLAVCPVLDPAAAVDKLDNGWVGYRHYFLRKWRQAFLEKQAAFPDIYDFSDARRLSRVSTLTDYFVSRHTAYRDAREYYSHYTLSDERLRALRVPVRILAAEDDPVIPAEHFRALQKSAATDFVTLTRHGGHCGFIENFSLRSALDAHAVEFFSTTC